MKKQSNALLKKKLWKVFATYIKQRDKGTCFTCGKRASGFGIHAGHFIPKSVGGIALYFHEHNVHAQCFNCNINLGGNQYIYGQKIGKKKVAELYKIKQQIVKDYPFQEKIEYYTQKIKEYEKERMEKI